MSDDSNEEEVLVLPKDYGPICVLILDEFIKFHNLPKDTLKPEKGLKMEFSLARIFDIMLLSMGKDKRKDLLAIANEYYMSIPFSMRHQ